MENYFLLTKEDLKSVTNTFQEKTEIGLDKKDQEILAIPTYIFPKGEKEMKALKTERILALDWGGTNFRAAIVEYKDGETTIIEKLQDDPNNPNKYRLSAKETQNFTVEKLLEKMAGFISELKELDERVTKIGYCFSYPTKADSEGDATLVRWTKEIDIPGMIDEPVGDMLLNYLNNHKSNIKTTFTDIRVINDTVACLFAGLTARTESNKAYDSYIGLIVGTGYNMACLMPPDKIKKIKYKYKKEKSIPINLESGNFNFSHLTIVDKLVDAMSGGKGTQLLEKAISGKYLAELFKTYFMNEAILVNGKIKYDFDGEDLSNIISKSANEKHVEIAKQICERSAQLVAATITGLVQALIKQDSNIKNIYLAVDGSVFWKTPNYKERVDALLKEMLPNGVQVKIPKEEMKSPNLTGAAMAMLF